MTFDSSIIKRSSLSLRQISPVNRDTYTTRVGEDEHGPGQYNSDNPSELENADWTPWLIPVNP